MSIEITIKLNKNLYLRDPQSSKLGQRIIKDSIVLIDKIGLEAYNFKKLAIQIGSTEASIYRYFENKHVLLIYLVSWYWEWISYLIDMRTMNIESAARRLKIIIKILAHASKNDPAISYVDQDVLHRLIIAEGTKAYHTKAVDSENQKGFFLNYKQLTDKIGKVILEINPKFAYPNALASNLFEMANNHCYFAQHLPRLTDVNVEGDDFSEVEIMLRYFAFTLIGKPNEAR